MRFRAAIAAMALLTAAAAPAFAQRAYTPPHDVYGHPSLEGVWTARWLTPLERSAGIPLELDAADGAARARQMLVERATEEAFDAELAIPDATSLAIVRGRHRTSLLVEPATGRLPLSDAGRAYLAATPRIGTDGPEQRLSNERCLMSVSLPGMLIAPAGMLKQMVQTARYVVLYSEAFSEVRILAPGAGPQAIGVQPLEGQSDARWDHDTLVVESTGFRPADRVRGVPFSRFPLRPETRITERFTRIGPKELLYEFRVDDPVLYTQVWRAEYSFTLAPERLYEFACHEGNYGLANILSGAREEERRAAGGAAR